MSKAAIAQLEASAFSTTQLLELIKGKDALVDQLQQQIVVLQRRIEWFNRQLFGSKSERFPGDPDPSQLPLAAFTDTPAATPPAPTRTVPAPSVAGLSPEQYTVIGEKISHRLAQRPGSYVVLKVAIGILPHATLVHPCTAYVRPLVKLVESQFRRQGMLPSNPFTQALAYARERRVGLEVFLADPDVPVDTNHLERALRAIPMGRRAWLFCWTELGAEQVGIVQSLMVTCRLHGIDPYTYLVDVLQRVGQHPASRVAELTPRLWKERYAAEPLRSDVHKADS